MQTTFVCLIKYSHYQFCLIWFISHTSPGTQPIRLTNLRYHLSYQPAVVSHGTLYPHTRCSPKSLLGKMVLTSRTDASSLELRATTYKVNQEIQAHACCFPSTSAMILFNLRSFSAATSWLQQDGICILHWHDASCFALMPAVWPAPPFSRSLIVTGANTSVPTTQWNNV